MPRFLPVLPLLAALLAGALLGGCGYTLGSGPGLQGFVGGRALRLEAVENRTLEADAGIWATRALARAAGARGGSISTKAQPGEAVLGGRLELLQTVPVGVGVPQSVSLWRLDARLVVDLRSSDTPPRVLAQAVAAGGEQFQSGTDIESTEAARRLAMARLFERLSAEALERLAAPR